MYIEGPLKSGKTSLLIENFIKLLNSEISTSEILVVCVNSYKKRLFIEKTREKLLEIGFEASASLPVYTFNGLVYNSILNNWPVIEEKIIGKKGNPVIIPNLCGLEVSEYVLKQSLKEIDKQDNFNFRDYRSGHEFIAPAIKKIQAYCGEFSGCK